MAGPLKFCTCKGCRQGLRCKFNSELVRGVVRKFRRKSKEALRRGIEPPNAISVPMTD